MKKLPDVKMGHLEGKNLTFSSDSEDPVANPNFVSIITHSKPKLLDYCLGKLTSNDQGRWNN
jgi:hypothetical protein